MGKTTSSAYSSRAETPQSGSGAQNFCANSSALVLPNAPPPQQEQFAADLASTLRSIVDGSRHCVLIGSYTKLGEYDVDWLAGGGSRELKDALALRLKPNSNRSEGSNVYEFFINRNLDNGSSGETLYSLVYDLNDGRLLGIVKRGKSGDEWGSPQVTRPFGYDDSLRGRTTEGMLAIAIQDFITENRKTNGNKARFLMSFIR